MRCRQCVSDSLMHAGDGIEQLRWRLDAGELPPEVPPKVIVLAIGSNARGMVRTPRILSMQANQSEPQRLSCDKHLLLILLVIGATLCPGLI